MRRGAFVRKVGREEQFADPNQILIFKRAEAYRVRHPVDGGDDCTALVFAPEVLQEAFGSRLSDGKEAVANAASLAPPDGVSQSLLYFLRAGLRAAQLSPLEIEETALAVLRRIAQCQSAKRNDSSRSRDSTQQAHVSLVVDTLSVLSERFCEPLSLAQIARMVHSSSYHLSRIFCRRTGLPIHQHLVRLRLAGALDALSDGATDLTKVALGFGFSSHSHFSTSFRRWFGLSPSEFCDRHSPRQFLKLSKILKALPVSLR